VSRHRDDTGGIHPDPARLLFMLYFLRYLLSTSGAAAPLPRVMGTPKGVCRSLSAKLLDCLRAFGCGMWLAPKVYFDPDLTRSHAEIA
jgi:hypothetical protein